MVQQDVVLYVEDVLFDLLFRPAFFAQDLADAVKRAALDFVVSTIRIGRPPDPFEPPTFRFSPHSPHPKVSGVSHASAELLPGAPFISNGAKKRAVFPSFPEAYRLPTQGPKWAPALKKENLLR